MKRLYFLSLSGTAFSMAFTTTVIASEWSIGGNVALTSDFVFRGFTQTDTNPAIQGGFNLDHTSGFFASVWGSNVESDSEALVNFDGANIELDTTLGWKSQITNSMELTASAMRMNYPGTNTNANNTNEFGLSLSYDFNPISIGGSVNYSNDSFGNGKSWYWDANVNVPAGPTLISLHAGQNQFDLSDDYTDYSIGISGEIADLSLALTYTGTKGVAGGCTTDTCDDRVTFTLSKYF